MPDLAFVAQILPGKVDDWRSVMARCQPEDEEYVASRRRLGIRREAAWLQSTPSGEMVVVYIDTDDPATTMRGLATSEEPFDVWFRQSIYDVHGLDLSRPPESPPELVVDYRA